MKTVKESLVVCVALLLLVGCSGAGSSTNGEGSSTIRVALPSSSHGHIVTIIPNALQTRYGYRLERNVVTTEDIRFETAWKSFSATPEEMQAGFGEVLVRITITARPRGRAGGSTGTTYTPRFVAEIVGTTTGSGERMEMPFSSQREEEIREIIDYLDNEFRAGVR